MLVRSLGAKRRPGVAVISGGAVADSFTSAMVRVELVMVKAVGVRWEHFK